MILSDLDHLPRQAGTSPLMKKALEFLKKCQAEELEPGRVEIDGKNVYALVQAYETLPVTPEVKFEAHRQYIDIQFIQSGEEVMGWTALDRLKLLTAYDPEKDVCYGKLPADEFTPLRVSAGQAAIFYPEDAHAPKLALSIPAPVKKIVVKVAVEGRVDPA